MLPFIGNVVLFVFDFPQFVILENLSVLHLGMSRVKGLKAFKVSVQGVIHEF